MKVTIIWIFSVVYDFFISQLLCFFLYEIPFQVRVKTYLLFFLWFFPRLCNCRLRQKPCVFLHSVFDFGQLEPDCLNNAFFIVLSPWFHVGFCLLICLGKAAPTLQILYINDGMLDILVNFRLAPSSMTHILGPIFEKWFFLVNLS